MLKPHLKYSSLIAQNQPSRSLQNYTTNLILFENLQVENYY
ncbi:MAG TPA: hypothetical protein [Caudoviricetes sp.]|nr:MAG TPA: hypothetical protein [Caudoviricetes sp.]